MSPPKPCRRPSSPERNSTVNWHNYVSSFFSGVFLANTVPHFVHGTSGDHFPTPFAHPPGKGLSSPTVNVLWALLNLVVGYALFRAGNVWSGGWAVQAAFFAAVAVISTAMSVRFAQKHRESE